MGLSARFLILSAVILAALSALPGAVWATAVATCARCEMEPCTQYCATPPCSPCLGEEGDTFIFYAGESSGTNRTYHWDFDADNVYDQSTSNPVVLQVMRRPHNPGTHPNGWPVKLKVVSNEFPSGVVTTIDVAIDNVAPTAVAYGIDAANQVQYAHVVVYVSINSQFFGSESFDHTASVVGQTGISAYAWDFDYNGSYFVSGATTPNPFKSWGTTGLRTVRLRVTDDDTPSKIAYADLTVEVIPDGPFARITGPTEPFSEGETVTLEGNSTGSRQAVTTWKWDLDYDGSTFTEQASGQTIYPSFAEARPYTVALRVTDTYGTSFTTTRVFTPYNLLPLADAQLRLQDATVLTPPYAVDEGVPLVFDASSSRVVPPDPGQIVSWQWDFDYDGEVFRPWSDTVETVHTFPLSSPLDGDLLPIPYLVRLRVTDDDDRPGSPSVGWLTLPVTVRNVPPQAAILVCTSAAATVCHAPESPVRLSQNEPGYFKVVDPSTNQDPIEAIGWDTDYTGVFTADPTYANLQAVTLSWLNISTPTLAVHITDGKGETSLATLPVEILDQPPKAVISPSGEEGVLTLDEGRQVRFSAAGTLVVPGDTLTLIRWDYDADPAVFVPDSPLSAHACTTGLCSLADWLSCTGGAAPDNTCPLGSGEITRNYPKGPFEEWILLCVEDLDDTGVCVSGADPSNPETARQFAALRVVVQNVAPVINPDDPQNRLTRTLTRGQTLSWCPTVIEPGADTLTFDCNPAMLPVGMECNTQTGCLSWTPGDDAVSCEEGDNPQSLSLTVCDDNGGCSTLDTNLTVLNQNAPPTIRRFIGAPSAAAGEPYEARIGAVDPDELCGDYPTYYLCGDVRSGMSLDLNGNFTWTPTMAQVGTHSVGFCAHDQHDGEDCSVCHWHSLTIVDPASLPRISAGPDLETDPGYLCLRGNVLANPAQYALDFSWRQEDGPAFLCLLDDPQAGEAPAVCLIAREAGTYSISLEADTGSYRVQDRVDVTVRNVPPVACVVGPRHWPLGAAVHLDGRCSGDANGETLSYLWTDPYEVLEDPHAPMTGFVSLPDEPPGVGASSFTLTGNDGVQTSAPADVALEILRHDDDGRVLAAAPHAVIDPPVAYLVLGDSVELDGRGSATRPPGGDLEFEWSRADGTILQALRDDPGRVRVTPDARGVTEIFLVVRDADRESRAARATLYVRPADSAVAASAGPDQSVTLESVCSIGVRHLRLVTLDGSASQRGPDNAVTCVWAQNAGPPVGLTTLDDCQAVASISAPGLYGFTLSLEQDGAVLSTDSTWVAVAASEATITLELDAPRWDAERRLAFVDPGLDAVLDASESFQTSGDALWLHWVQTSGPAQALDSWDTPRIAFTPDLPGLSIGLRLWGVTLDGSASLPLDVTVVALSRANLPPVCVLAEAALAAVPGQVVELDASASYDPNDDELFFLWRQRLAESDDDLPIEDAENATARVSSSEGGVYIFEAVVSDGIERCISAPLTLTVSPNRPPLADAGGDRSACSGDTVTLDATGSHDPDGHELAYLWHIMDDGGTGLIDADFVPDASSPTPQLRTMDPGRIRIELRASDGFSGGESEPDTLTLTVDSLCDDSDGDLDEEGPDPEDGDEEGDLSEKGAGCSCRQPSSAEPAAIVMILVLLAYLRRRARESAGR